MIQPPILSIDIGKKSVIILNMEDILEIEKMISDLPHKMNDLWSIITKMSNLRYQYLIYKLLKKGLVRLKDLSEITGLSEPRLYDIVDMVDKLLHQPV